MSRVKILQKLLGLAEKEGVEAGSKLATKAEMEAAEDILKMNPSLAKDLKLQQQDELAKTFNQLPPRSPADLSAEVFEQSGLPNFEMVGKVRSEIPKGDLGKLIDEPKDFVLQGKPYSGNVPAKVNAPLQTVESKLPAVRQSAPMSRIDEAIDVTPNARKLSKFEEILEMAKANKLPIGLGLGGLSLSGDSSSLPQNKEQRMTPIPPMGMAESLKARAELPQEEELPVEPMEQALEEAPEESQQLQQVEQPPEQSNEVEDLASLLAVDENRGKFSEALDRKNLSILGNQLGQAGNIIGGALARTGPSAEAQKLFASNVDIAKTIPEDFKQQIAMDEHDPESAVSKNYREFLAKRGYKVGPGITASQIKQTLLPAVEKRELQKEKLQQQKDLAEFRQKALALKEQEQKDYKKERLNQTATNLAKRQLESAKTRALNTIGGTAGTALRNRIVASDAIFSTVGIPTETNESDIDKLDVNKLNQLPRQFIAELTVETNRMLTGTGIPAQSTFQKMLPKNIKMDAAGVRDYVTSKLGPAEQADFVKLVLKTAARVKQNSKKSLGGLVKKSFSGTDHIKRQLPEDYENVINELELDPADFGLKTKAPVSQYKPGQILEIKGKRYKVGDDGDSLIPQ